jgi:hypothetical protein
MVLIGIPAARPGLAQETDRRLTAAAAWAEAQAADPNVKYNWGSGTATECERFIEEAFGTKYQYETASDPDRDGAYWNLQDRGLELDPNQPGLIQLGVIVYFEANASNGGAGHAGIYIGNGEMISVGDLGVTRSKVSDWSDHVAPLLGFAAPREDWPGLTVSDTPPNVPDGGLIKGGGPTIFVFSGGQKHAIPDWITFLMQGGAPDLANVQVLSDGVLNAITDGEPISSTSTPASTVAQPAGPAQPAAGPAPQANADAYAPRGDSHEASASIGHAGQVDRYSIGIAQGQRVEVWAKRTSGTQLGPVIHLMDPSGRQEGDTAYDSNGETHFSLAHAASGGQYTVTVSGTYDSQGPYTITWFIDRLGKLANGSQLNAEISRKDQLDRYQLQLAQGQRVELWATRTSGTQLGPTMRLIDPTGHQEGDTAYDNNGDSHLELKSTASSGTYWLDLWGNYDSRGPYALTSFIDRYVTFTSGATIDGEISRRSQLDRYILQVNQGQTIELYARRTSGTQLGVAMRLIDPTGHQEGDTAYDNNGEAHLILHRAASAGRYILDLWGNYDSRGQYQLAGTVG